MCERPAWQASRRAQLVIQDEASAIRSPPEYAMRWLFHPTAWFALNGSFRRWRELTWVLQQHWPFAVVARFGLFFGKEFRPWAQRHTRSLFKAISKNGKYAGLGRLWHCCGRAYLPLSARVFSPRRP